MVNGELQPDFVIGNMATDLVDLTLELCNKDHNKSPRFPERYYSSYVSDLIHTAIKIQENVCIANSIKHNSVHRKDLQEEAKGLCVCMEKLTLSAYRKGWISEKQFVRWQKIINALHWRIHKWIHS